MGEQDKLIERLKSVRVGSAKWTNALNRLLDASRTEGRGEGETRPFSVISENGLSLHPATADLVSRFMGALAEKLAAAEAKYGYSDGWASPIWQEECRRQLHHHAAKGDPRDVAAYAAFCWHHGWSTASPIREPEISRTQIAMARIIDPEAWKRADAFISRDPDYADVLTASSLAKADAILNLAPVEKGAGAEPGAGWVYNSPDTGMEYSPEHPLESGEIPDATDVRRSTFFEDWMFGEIGRLDAKVRELVVNLAPVGGRGEEGSSQSQPVLSPKSDTDGPHAGGVGLFGQTLRAAREKCGLSLQQLADGVGLSKAQCWDLEVGRSQNPTIKTLAKLAWFLGTPLERLTEAAACAHVERP